MRQPCDVRRGHLCRGQCTRGTRVSKWEQKTGLCEDQAWKRMHSQAVPRRCNLTAGAAGGALSSHKRQYESGLEDDLGILEGRGQR